MNCPGCGAAMSLMGSRRYFHCDHCGQFHFPQETDAGISPLGELAKSACPACETTLQTALIDGESVSYCDHCRGFLARLDAFGRIVGKRRAMHGSHEQVMEPFDQAELQRRLKCPSCHKSMDAHPYFGGGNAVVDTCDRCRLIWLDAGELAIIERFVPHGNHIEPTIPLAEILEPQRLSTFGSSPTLGLEDLF
ncbi:MAG: zf-TFIIB domain-containing protein [Gemmataceae bacterium]